MNQHITVVPQCRFSSRNDQKHSRAQAVICRRRFKHTISRPNGTVGIFVQPGSSLHIEQHCAIVDSTIMLTSDVVG
jgi:hypothetical protein